MSADAGEAVAVPRVHLDSASGLPLHPAAREVWLAAVDQGWADPLRLHNEGRTARLLLDNARAAMAEILRCRPDELSFVPSGTTACHLAVLGLLRGRARLGERVVHSAVEHSAVLQAANWGAQRPADATESVPVDAFGRIDLDAWTAAVAAPGVALACLQSANHEVGTTQPLEQAADACRRHEVPLFVDCAASLGWLAPPTVGDVLAASAHKWGGPAGVGVLVVRKGTRWRRPWPDDEREPAMAGFVDIPSAMAAAAALQAVEADRETNEQALYRMTTRLRAEIVDSISDVDVAGHPETRLPHIVNFSCLYVDGEALVTELDQHGFAVSSGSACTASSLQPSHVLAAMGVLTHGNVRVSLAPTTSSEDLWRFVDTMAQIVPKLRASTGITPPPSPLTGRHRGGDA